MENNNIKRFFSILTGLLLELKKILCNRSRFENATKYVITNKLF